MKCIDDSQCRRVFVRESKNCIRLVTVWEGACMCVHAHKDCTQVSTRGFISTRPHADKKQRPVGHSLLTGSSP